MSGEQSQAPPRGHLGESRKFSRPCFSLMALEMLCSSHTCSLSWDKPSCHSLESKEIFMALRYLERISSKSCHNVRTDFKFQENRGYQNPKGTEAPVLTIRRFSTCLTEDYSEAWDKSPLDKSLSNFDHNQEQLEQKIKVESLQACTCFGIVQRNFQELSSSLKQGSFSQCALELIRGKTEVRFSPHLTNPYEKSENKEKSEIGTLLILLLFAKYKKAIYPCISVSD